MAGNDTFYDMSSSPQESDAPQDEADTTTASQPSKESKESGGGGSSGMGFNWNAGRDMNFISGNDIAESFNDIWNQGIMGGEGGEILRSVPLWKNPIALISGAVIIGSVYYLSRG
jgi:hypothetical protein